MAREPLTALSIVRTGLINLDENEPS